jgi:hypothetical protein
VPDGLQQLPGECPRVEFVQQLLHRPEPDREVVTVVAVAQDRIEACQALGVPVDREACAQEAGTQGVGVDRRLDRRLGAGGARTDHRRQPVVGGGMDTKRSLNGFAVGRVYVQPAS